MTFVAPLVGRERELEELAQLLERERLVTIVGPPGIGKTRLGVTLCRARGGRFCDLSTTSTVFEICAAVGQTLERAPAPGETPDHAVTAIGGELGETLVVLDNFEQVASLAPETIGRWLEIAPRTQFVVTSRERLGLDGERVYEVMPLEESAAARLLLDRATRLGRGAPWMAEDEPAIAAIVRALDGIPLALELAAPRLVSLGPALLLERLRERFELLRATGRGHPDRQATLWTAIESSWQMLTPTEQDALAQCAVFRGGFTVQAAERVLSAGSVLDVLQQLVDRSLLFVRPTRPPRHDCYLSIRELAERKLEERGSGETRARHARHYIAQAEALVSRLEGAQAAAARADFERERDNLVAAVRWTLSDHGDPALAARGLLALHAHAVNVGPLSEHLPLLDRGVEVLADRPELLCRLLDGRGYARLRIGNIAEGIADLERALSLARQSGDAAVEASALRSMGVAYVKQHRLAEAKASYECAIALAQEAGDRRMEGIATGAAGVVRLLDGDPHAARELLGRALAIHREVGNAKFEGVVHGNLADVHLELGELDDALEHYERGLALNRATGNRFSEAFAQGSIAVVHHVRGDLDRALELYSAAVSMAEHAGEKQYEAAFAGYAGVVELEHGALDSAERWLDRAVSGFAALGDEVNSALFASYRAVVDARRGRVDDAERAIEDAMRVMPDRLFAVVCAQLAHVDLARGRARRAAERAAALTLRGEDGASAVDVSVDARLAMRLLSRICEPDTSALTISADGSCFCMPEQPTVDVTKHRALARMLAALLLHRLRAPGTAVTPETLVACGWPGERMRSTSARNRLHVALSTLRKLGLGDVLLARDGGYLLDPEVPINIAR